MDRGTAYAELVVSGKRIAGKTEYLCCKRHLDDLEKDDFPYIYDENEAEKHISLANELYIAEGASVEKLHTRGFQDFIIGSIFGWKNKVTGERRYREAYVQVARQNGKSFICGILCNDFAGFSGESYRNIFCAATKQDQAQLVWDEVRKFIESDEDLADEYKVQEYKHLITHKDSGNRIRAIGRDTKSADGFRSILAVIDEYHAHPTNQMYKLMQDGQIKVPGALTIAITTAGFNLNSPCYEHYKFCKSVLSKEIDGKDDLFIYICEPDLPDKILHPVEYEAAISDPREWAKANPLNLWQDDTTLSQEYIDRFQSKYVTACNKGGAEMVNYLTKSVNVWVTAGSDGYVDVNGWDAGACDITLDDLRGQGCYLGVDLSSGGDLTSIALLFCIGNGKIYVYSHSFLPTMRLAEHEAKDIAPYRQWVQDGLITLTGDPNGTTGLITSYKAVCEHISTLLSEYDLKLLGVGYDPYNAAAFLPDLEKACDYADLTEIVQSVQNLSEPTEQFALQVEAKNVCYDRRNKLLCWSVMNSKLVVLPNGLRKIDKQRRNGRIDPVDAVIDAYKLYFTDNPDSVTDKDLDDAWEAGYLQ